MTVFFISDTHFGHTNILSMKDKYGNPLREFASIDDMDDRIITNWNRVIRPSDKVYHLGDVALSDYGYGRLPVLLEYLNGHKRLIVGNHDRITDPRLIRGFESVMFWKSFKEYGFTCSHVPLRNETFESKYKLNVHGHIHNDRDPTPNHMNISVERTNYHPVSLDEINDFIQRNF